MWDPTHLCLQMEWHDMSSILLCSKYITNAKYSISHEIQPPLKFQEHLYKTPKVEQYDLGDVQGSLQVIVHKEVASLWSEARTGATEAPEKSAIQSFEFWTELCIALLRRGGGGGVTWKGPIESRASRGSGSWQPCALYSSHRHIAIPVMRWMTTQLKVGISQLSKLLGPAVV